MIIRNIIGVIWYKIYSKRLGWFNVLYNMFLPLTSLLIFILLYQFIDFENFLISPCFYICCLLSFLFIFSLVMLFRSFHYNRKIYKQLYSVVRPDEHVLLKCGMPGSFKTLTAVNQSLLTADIVWSDLSTEFWELSSKTDEQLSKDTMLLKRWRIVQKGYEFWSNFDGIKCFASNIPVERNGKFGIMLTRGMLEQKEYLPPFCVCLGDEIGSFCTLKESMINFKNYRMEDEGRFSRHFEYWFIFTEQQPENFTKSLRNVVGLNELMQGGTWVLKPKFLLCVCSLLLKIGLKFKLNGKYVRFYSRLNTFAKRLGYFSINSSLMGNMELGAKDLGKCNIKTFHSFDFKYDSKCFSSLYLCKDYDVLVYKWRSTSLPKNSPIAKSILQKYEIKK